MSFKGLKMGFGALKTSFEADHGRRGLRCSQLARLTGSSRRRNGWDGVELAFAASFFFCFFTGSLTRSKL
jgi:hypothetical protein